MSATSRRRLFAAILPVVAILIAGCSYTVERPAASSESTTATSVARTRAATTVPPVVTARSTVTARPTATVRPRTTPIPVPAGPPPFPGRYFHPGDSSPDIKVFQDRMHARGFFPVGTGDYGPNTLAMVKRLQTQNGLTPNGEIGPNTWKLAWTGSYQSDAASADVFIGVCNYQGKLRETRPVTVIFGCDGTGALTGMSWSRWTTQSADGTGLGTFTDCTPDCATSPRYTVAVVVHLSDPQPAQTLTSCTAGALWWATMTIAFPDGLPQSFTAADAPETFDGMPASDLPDLPSAIC